MTPPPTPSSLPPEIAALLDAYAEAYFANKYAAFRDDEYGDLSPHELRVSDEQATAARTALETALTALLRDGERLDWLLSPLYSWEAAAKVERIASAFRAAYPNGGLVTDEALRAAIDAARTPSSSSLSR